MRKKTALPDLCFGIFLFLIYTTTCQASTSAINDIDRSRAIILAYENISEETDTYTGITNQDFDRHIAQMQREGYKILPLIDIIKAYRQKQSLPPKTAAITFDLSDNTALKHAIPLLMSKNLPFTVFYSSELADHPSGDSVPNWTDILKIKNYTKADLGILLDLNIGKDDTNKILTMLNKAKTKHRTNLKHDPELLAYYNGIYQQFSKDLVRENGYSAAFSLTPGPAHKYSDLFALPRFSMSNINADKNSFQLILNSMPMPVTNIEPQTPVAKAHEPIIGFTLHEELFPFASKVECFSPGIKNSPKIEVLGNGRIELRLNAPLKSKLTEINCILPIHNPDEESKDEENNIAIWRWLGLSVFLDNN